MLFPQETLLSHKTVDVRCDLMDTRVSICSVAVPPLFSDNFDFQTRDDFIRGLLMNEEILSSALYTYILPPSEYAATVTSWQTYHSIRYVFLISRINRVSSLWYKNNFLKLYDQ